MSVCVARCGELCICRSVTAAINEQVLLGSSGAPAGGKRGCSQVKWIRVNESAFLSLNKVVNELRGAIHVRPLDITVKLYRFDSPVPFSVLIKCKALCTVYFSVI